MAPVDGGGDGCGGGVGGDPIIRNFDLFLNGSEKYLSINLLYVIPKVNKKMEYNII